MIKLLKFSHVFTKVFLVSLPPLQPSGLAALCFGVLEASAVGIAVLDIHQPDWPVVMVNAAYETMTGYDRDELIGRGLGFLNGDDLDQPGCRIIHEAVVAGNPCEVVVRDYRKDGTLFWNRIRLTPLRDEKGGITHYVGVYEDITAQKQAQDALARSEARYRDVFHGNRAVKLLIDPETGNIRQVNQAASDFYGYSVDQLQSMRIQDINMLSQAEVQAEMQRAKRQERNFFEFRHQLASGEVRDVDVFSSPITTADGPQLYSIVVDVTGKREGEQAREKALQNLGMLHLSALDLLTMSSEEKIYTYLGETLAEWVPQATVLVNRTNPDGSMTLQGIYGAGVALLERAKQLLGYSLVGHTYEKDPHIHPLFEQGVLTPYAGGLVALAANTMPKAITQQLVRLLSLRDVYLIGLRRDNTLYAGIQFYTHRDYPIKQPTLIEAFVQQVSLAVQRVQAVKSLHESERRYRALFEQSNDGVFLLSTDGKHLAVNHRGAEMLGCEPDEVVGLSYRDVVAPEQHSNSENILNRLLAGEHIFPYERQFRRRDGTVFPAEVNVEVVWGLDGPLHIQSVVRDITERREAEQQAFNRALERERIRLLAEFIENASHEFRTPLAAINTAAYLMKRMDDPEKRADKSRVVEAQVARMTRLVDMLLLMAKLENIKTLTQAGVNLNLVLQTVHDGVVPAAPEITVTLDLAGEPLLTMGDEDYLVTAVGYLVENAVKYTLPGGTVTLATGTEKDVVWIDVTDSGVGISADALPHIFETFWREDKAHTQPGFGVGLSIAQRVIRLHHGEIEVESRVGQGSRFRVWLPRVSEKLAPSE
jgi:PAS domain S-box-containing protein